MQISDDRTRKLALGTRGMHGLPDEAYVVRGGMSQPWSFKVGSHPSGPYGISCQSAPGMTVEELAKAGQFPNSQISITTVGAIRGIGGNVIPTPNLPGFPHHGTITAPNDVWSQTWREQLNQLFDTMPNPFPVRRLAFE
jgi:hypothetical protein